MASLTHHPVARIKADLSFNGSSGGRCMFRETWAVYGGLDKATACSSQKILQLRILEGRGSPLWLLAPRAFLDSQTFELYMDPLKAAVYGKSLKGRKSTKEVIQCIYGPGSAGSDGTSGDSKVQQMLVDMVRIQVGKVRMTDIVDERSQYLRNIADDALVEYDRIAYRTMKGLDATESRVLRQLDADANAIEKELKITRAELEAQSRDFEEFQVRIAYSRNEGLFFKNLYPRPLSYQSMLSKKKMEEKVVVVTATSGNNVSSNYRQLLYGGLSLVMVSFIWSSSSAFLAGTCMRASKLASYGIIISLLLTQLAYVKVITGEANNLEESEDQSE